VSEKSVWRRIFGPERWGRERVMGEGVQRRMHNVGFYDCYYSPSIIRMIKSRRMIWVWHVHGVAMKFLE
jgi:hypothetical protein